MLANYLILVFSVVSFVLALLALLQVLLLILGRKNISQPRYPSAEKRSSIKQYCIGFILFILIAMTGCSPTASLPNGCKYKVHPPKFTK